MQNFFVFQNFTKNFGIITFVLQCFFAVFFNISSQQIIIRSYTIMFAMPRRKKWKIPRNFIKMFQQHYQPISKCFNSLKMSAELPQRCSERIIRGGSCRITENTNSKFGLLILIWTFFVFFFSIFLIGALVAQHL